MTDQHPAAPQPGSDAPKDRGRAKQAREAQAPEDQAPEDRAPEAQTPEDQILEEQTPVVSRISRRWPLVSAAVAVALVAALGILLAVRGNVPFEADAEWMEEILEHRNPAWEVPSLLMNFLGGGWFAFALPGAIVILLCVRREFWSALFLGVASVASALIVQLLKGVVGRPRPEDMLVTADFGSFPSGHSANAATLVVCLGIILWRGWFWAIGVVYVVLMMLSRTYLGAHWVSDTVGGLLVGVAAALIVWAPLARKVRAETLT